VDIFPFLFFFKVRNLIGLHGIGWYGIFPFLLHPSILLLKMDGVSFQGTTKVSSLFAHLDNGSVFKNLQIL
jgi:hypothetical protein